MALNELWYDPEVKTFEEQLAALAPIAPLLVAALRAQTDLLLAVLKHDQNNIRLVLRGEQQLAHERELQIDALARRVLSLETRRPISIGAP